MNKILEQIKIIIDENIKEYLPNIKPKNLEGNGAIYYMNGQNGTLFDYYVNEHLPYFMVFYNDKNNLGAAKLILDIDGNNKLLLYDKKGKNLLKEIDVEFDASKNDILKFATILKTQMDDNNNWDANIDLIDASIEPVEDEINSFIDSEADYGSLKNRFILMPKIAFVSKRTVDEGYKVGYMLRSEPINDDDSGWQFFAGNETDEYSNNNENIALLSVEEVHDLDSDIWNYIDSPIGSKLIRISSSEFEEDHEDKEIFIEKR